MHYLNNFLFLTYFVLYHCFSIFVDKIGVDHFTETLAAELGLAAQRLLGDQGAGAGGTGVDLIIHQVVQLQEVDIAHGDLVVEALTGTAVI